ncbi:hypothetical protein BX616_000637 [Lobosporangium transversale]|uniref:SGNH hydrolase-type esterase domain-containing protein n=1 Tax=Lobosporangium transversale TaxID=64571 RepID=A0A1Y2GQ85_9FUNG|nr:SGNH hydrolase-type esterase domain-containing protein [Lobosporangium transversale]KAF9906756.1 hypothetical protein BX616_000637 [Lobosporangium transversale]ORZ19069.1 SGNH hydrolase-type esterase domain-containing protein [Lobosporangium transversale]|eukprot:XP_021882237.1 SGNH hydrolase-type esterase domain-containing protein [Lobosporangium transversale]
MQPEAQNIKVLCLGDSLTAGFANWYTSSTYTPYSDYLTTLFKAQGRNDIEFINAGVNGDTVKCIQERLATLLKKDNYQHVILLGGTNDLADVSAESTPEDAVAHIDFEPMFRLLLAQPHLKSILQLTVPISAYDVHHLHYRSCKAALNNRILNNSCEKLKVLDLNDSTLGFNYLHLSEDEQARFWSDGLHYTPEGYEHMAQCIFNELVKVLQK